MNPDLALQIENLTNGHRALFDRFDPNDCIAAFDRLPMQSSYHEIPNDVKVTWNAVTDQFGADGFDAFQRLTLSRLIGLFAERAASRRYTNAIISCFEKSFARIIGHIADPNCEKYRSENDILYKDLGLCRQKIFPAGAQVVEPDSGFRRSLIFDGGLRHAVDIAKLLLEAGGNRHWYQIHTHLSELDSFNPEGWNACYLRLAEMLELNPRIRGMWGGSWFYDPALERISPRLVYLRQVPQEHGAKVFYSNVDIDGGALSKSESRKRAYEAGDYLPRSYALIWSRNALLKWAATFRDSGSGE